MQSKYDQLLKTVNKLENELRGSFTAVYALKNELPNNLATENLEPGQQSQLRGHQCHNSPIYVVPSYYSTYYPMHHSWYNPWICPWMSPLNSFNYVPCQPQVVHVHHNSDTKSREKGKEQSNEKEESSQTEKIVALAGAAAISFGAVYIASQDEYVKYRLSNVNDLAIELENFNKYSNDMAFKKEVAELLISYSEWKNSYTNRSSKTFSGKVGLIGSGFSGLGGLYLADANMKALGFVGVTLFGCYLFWRYLTGQKRSEKELFDDVLNKINRLYLNVSQKERQEGINHEMDPSAPIEEVPAYTYFS